MMVAQLATRVPDRDAAEFKSLTARLGTSPSDALRMFVSAFNAHGGFPYEVRVVQSPEPFETEEEATDFAMNLARKNIDEAR
jgi:DNA-damage-inducible protein J